MKLTFYSTPGHGYLRVPKAVFLKCGGNPDKISGYSGHTTDTLFLEEDSDATYFLDVLKERDIQYEINESYRNSVVSHNYNPDLFYFRMETGDKVVLNDDRAGVINNVGKNTLIEVGGLRYKLPKSNPFRYIKGVIK